MPKQESFLHYGLHITSHLDRCSSHGDCGFGFMGSWVRVFVGVRSLPLSVPIPSLPASLVGTH